MLLPRVLVRGARRALGGFLVVGMAVGASALAGLLARSDWNWAKPAVEWSVQRLTGRALEIRGDLRVDLGRRTAVEAAGIRFGNASWARVPEMLVADRIFVRLRGGSLLRGVLALDRLEAQGAVLSLERRSDGAANWTLRGSSSRSGPPRLPTTVALRNVAMRLDDPARPQGFELHVVELDARAEGDAVLVSGLGVYQQQRFELRGAFSRRADEPSAATALVGRAAVGTTEVSAEGWVGGAPTSVDVMLEARGQSLDEIWRLIGFPLPRSPEFTLSGRLTHRDETTRLADLEARIGNSDISGDLTIHLPRDDRMWIGAQLRSREIDLDDLEGFWGRPPREEREGGAAAPPGTATSVFPEVPFDLSKLRVADARIRFRADQVRGKTVLDDVRLDAALQNGTLELRPLSLGMSAGELTTHMFLDARGREPRLVASLAVRGVDLATLIARSGSSASAGGQLGGRAELRSRGDSLRELARRADGALGVELQNGWISDPTLELVALHLGGYLRARLDRDEPAPIRCLVGVFDARDGVLATRALLLDTAHVQVEGTGTIDLAREEVALELEQHSKHLTLAALKTPIVVEGPLTARRARLKSGPLALRGGAALALGSIHPLAALLAFVDPGSEDEPGACAAARSLFRPIAGGLPTAASTTATRAGPVPPR